MRGRDEYDGDKSHSSEAVHIYFLRRMRDLEGIHHIAMLDIFFALVEPDRDRPGEEVALRLPMIVFRNGGPYELCKCPRGNGGDG